VPPAHVWQVFRDTMSPEQVGPVQAHSMAFTAVRQAARDPQLLRCRAARAVQQDFWQLFAFRSFLRGAVAALLLLVAVAAVAAVL